MVIDKPYGIRVACEAEWWPEYPNRTPEHQLSELEKDFEKLTAVKGDIKLFIFEGDEADLGQLASKYLSGNAQIINKEAFLAMRWTKDNHFVCHWWKPEVNTTVTFEKLT